jgi:hypothetical protein
MFEVGKRGRREKGEGRGVGGLNAQSLCAVQYPDYLKADPLHFSRPVLSCPVLSRPMFCPAHCFARPLASPSVIVVVRSRLSAQLQRRTLAPLSSTHLSFETPALT